MTPAASTRPGSSHLESLPRSGCPQRRRRTALACNRCRSRKIKCNGSHPSCFPCFNSGLSCEYRISEGEQESPNEFQQRLETMEAIVQSLQEKVIQPSQPSTKAQRLFISFEDLADSDMTSADQTEIESEDESPDSDEAFYGASSTIAFLRTVLKCIDLTSLPTPNTSYVESQLESIRPEHSPPSAFFCSKRKVLTESSSEDDLYVLPDRRSTTLFVAVFFRGYGSMNPFLDDTSFARTHVADIYEGRQQPKASRLALLNMVLAIACTTSIDPEYSVERRIWLSKRFYRRARGLYTKNIFQGADLDLVQTFLLMTQYLQSTEGCANSWLTHGLAVQAAIQIGLHTKKPPPNSCNEDRECRTRTWHACVILDRALSMQFGRPCLIPRQTGEVPLPVDVRFMGLSAAVEPSVGGIDATGLSFFIQSIKLYDVLWHILDSLYRNNHYDGTPTKLFEFISRAAKCEQELDNWVAGLPSLFRMETNIDKGVGTGSSISANLVTMLRLRYYGVRNLIHRPVLERFLSCLCDTSDVLSTQPDEFNHIVVSCQHSLQISATSSARIIALASSFDYGEVVPGMWWTVLYFVLNAAVTCFALILLQVRDRSGQLQKCKPISELRDCIGLAAQALPKLAPAHPAIRRAADFLHRILEVCDCLTELALTDNMDSWLQLNSRYSQPLIEPSNPHFPAEFSDMVEIGTLRGSW